MLGCDAAVVRRRDTLADPTPRELQVAIQNIADAVARKGDDDEGIVDRLQEIARHLTPPTLPGILAELEHPRVWPTRAHTLWLAGRLSIGAHLIAEFIPDAEITGSTTTAGHAREWLVTLGIDPPAALDPMGLQPRRVPTLPADDDAKPELGVTKGEIDVDDDDS